LCILKFLRQADRKIRPINERDQLILPHNWHIESIRRFSGDALFDKISSFNSRMMIKYENFYY
jgi:hypothetical protein